MILSGISKIVSSRFGCVPFRAPASLKSDRNFFPQDGQAISIPPMSSGNRNCWPHPGHFLIICLILAKVESLPGQGGKGKAVVHGRNPPVVPGLKPRAFPEDNDVVRIATVFQQHRRLQPGSGGPFPVVAATSCRPPLVSGYPRFCMKRETISWQRPQCLLVARRDPVVRPPPTGARKSRAGCRQHLQKPCSPAKRTVPLRHEPASAGSRAFH
jgi:hypothetical protein